jgi:phage baseplate assembly protein W
MAIVLGQRKVKDLLQFDDYAIGITLPIQIGNTAFNQSFKTVDQIKTNIKNLLLTKRGERIMQPNIGSGLQELIFDFNDDTLAQKIEEVITTAISTWLPFVSIDEINVQQTDDFKDTNSVEITMNFTIADTSDLSSVSFTI